VKKMVMAAARRVPRHSGNPRAVLAERNARSGLQAPTDAGDGQAIAACNDTVKAQKRPEKSFYCLFSMMNAMW
jgi:hypothetical protein